MLFVGSIEISFLFNHQHHPVIEVQGKQYSSLGPLLDKYPIFTHTQHLDKLAQMANFLAKGLEFQFIENIESFKEKYYQQIETEQSSLLYEGSLLKDYGIFDLSSMHPPHLKDRQLLFFVKQDYMGIPYRANLRYPLNDSNPMMAYELLPLLAPPIIFQKNPERV